jgi:beta-lactamase class A
MATDLTALAAELNRMCDDQPFNTHWYLKDLRTGMDVHRDGHEVVPSASTRKIAILMTALKQVNDGKISLDDPFVVEERFQKTQSGCFQHLKPGFQITLYDALVMMIIVSDNACTGKIAEIVTLDSVNDLCRQIGMTGTTHRTGWGSGVAAGLPWDHPVAASNATTAADLGVLLDAIVNGLDDPDAAARLGCTPDLCRLGLDILSWQNMRQRLPLFLPMGTRVAHKTGTGVRNYNDAGVIFEGDVPRYIMAVLTDQVPRELPDGMPGSGAASVHAGRLCRAAWGALVG